MLAKDGLIDTDELRTFDLIATKRSFSLAAAELGCSQSTISQRIARLEKRVGRLLIRRTTRQMVLTPDGEAMLIYARSILSLAEEARLRLASPEMEGVLKVGIEDEFATTRLPHVLALFCHQFPNFGIRLITGRNEHLHDVLRTNQVDIILGKSHGPREGAVPIWEEKLVWIGHPHVIGAPDEPLKLITYSKISITREIVENALIAARRPWVNIVESSNLIGKLAAAEAGLGVMAIGQSFSTPNLEELLPEECGLPPLPTLSYVLEKSDHPSSPAVEAFSVVLREAAKESASVKWKELQEA